LRHKSAAAKSEPNWGKARVMNVTTACASAPSTVALTCSAAFEGATKGRLFPDEIVSCGPASVVVPYTDPGLPLARKTNELIDAFIEDYGELPKVVLMQNHGLFALGATAHEVEAITAMAVKAARVLMGTFVFGGPHFLTPENVARIHTRPDEQYRRKRI